MTVTVASFRASLPEFADGARYPNAVITFWLAVAEQSVNTSRWGQLSDLGKSMMVAHQITLERRAMDAAAKGGVPGLSSGLVSSKSVDKVSVGYDTQGGAALDAGHWNLTIYGTRFIQMARLMGTGGYQVGQGTASSISAWGGPWTFNFPNQSG